MIVVRNKNKLKKTHPLDISPLINALNHFHPLSKEVIHFLKEKLVFVKCPKNTILLESGKVCNFIYFIQKGLVRGFISEGKKDITTWVSSDNELASSIYSLDQEIPALENIEAIEDCEFLALHSKHLQQLYRKFPEFNITTRKLLQQYYRDAERRALLTRFTNATFKYQFFLEYYPHLSNRVPLKYISSFLGIAFETLSRIRKKMAVTKK